MKNIFYILFFFYSINLFAQNHMKDENITTLIEKYSKSIDIKCYITIKIDVEGMDIPDKQVYVELGKDKRPIVKGKGLALLPKKGLVGQFKELFSTPLQSIFLSRRGKNLVYKLVSLDQKSDWITADIVFGEQSLLIYEATINTRKQGTFFTTHFYEDSMYPTKSMIIFNIKKFNVPLKFIGRSRKTPNREKNNKEVLGNITLLYTYL